MTEQEVKRDEHLDTLLVFLRRTRNGEYARVDEKSVGYPRLDIFRETIEDEYYYGIG